MDGNLEQYNKDLRDLKALHRLESGGDVLPPISIIKQKVKRVPGIFP